MEHATATRRASSLAPSLRGAPGRGSFAERAGQAFLDEALLGPVHGRRADTHGARDQVVGGLGVRGEENLRPLDLANGPWPPLMSACSWCRSSAVSVTR